MCCIFSVGKISANRLVKPTVGHCSMERTLIAAPRPGSTSMIADDSHCNKSQYNSARLGRLDKISERSRTQPNTMRDNSRIDTDKNRASDVMGKVWLGGVGSQVKESKWR